MGACSSKKEEEKKDEDEIYRDPEQIQKRLTELDLEI